MAHFKNDGRSVRLSVKPINRHDDNKRLMVLIEKELGNELNHTKSMGLFLICKALHCGETYSRVNVACNDILIETSSVKRILTPGVIFTNRIYLARTAILYQNANGRIIPYFHHLLIPPTCLNIADFDAVAIKY